MEKIAKFPFKYGKRQSCLFYVIVVTWAHVSKQVKYLLVVEFAVLFISIGGNTAAIYIDAELSVEIWERDGRGQGIYSGYHFGHLFMVIFEVSNRVRCKE